ncbi:hypothetical protein KAX17_16275, partial [Candidatus Bipolaricaulota bacterium]|nr:hypothetical protein [Candidatus Bipolaricaulota bacterium]
VEIAGEEGHLQIYIDGWLALEYKDPHPLLKGGIALETLDVPSGSGRGSSSAYVDDVEVRPFVRTALEQEWVRTGGPLGGLGYDIRMRPDNPDIMYVTDAHAGVHKSVDGGMSWFPSNTGITTRAGMSGDLIPIFSLTIDPHDYETLWAGTQEALGIYKSIDGGRTWTKMINGVVERFGISFRGFTVDPRSPDIVYAAAELASWCWSGEGRVGRNFDMTKGVVYKTTDGGRNWRAIWRGDNLARYVWVDPRDSDVIYVSTGIFDREAANSDPDRGIPGGVGIVKSTDGGATWFHANEGLGNLYVASLYMHPENPDILLAGTGNEVYTEGNGVYLSTDGGSSWEHVLSEGRQNPADSIVSVEFATSNASIAYAASANFVYRSEDGGHTWHHMTSGHGHWGPPGVIAGRPIDIQVDPRDPDRLFVNNYGGGNFLSTDGGRTWTDVSKGYTGGAHRDIAVDPNNPQRVLAVVNNGVFESANAGEEWVGVLYPPASSLEWFAGAISPVNPDHLLAANEHVVFQSRVGGRWWQVVYVPSDPMTIGIGVIRFAPSAPATVYAGTMRSSSLFGGTSFFLMDRVSAEGILVSHDGGTTWSEANDSSSEDAAVTDLAVSPYDSRVVYAATANHGMLKSIDGGRSWTAINRGLPLNLIILSVACHPDDPQIVCAGLQHAGVYRSTDGGFSWRPSSAGMNPESVVSDIVFSPANGSILFASDLMTGVYRSSDGGMTWRAVNQGLSVRDVRALGISSDGRFLYAGTSGGGMYRLDLANQDVGEGPVGSQDGDRDGDGVPDDEDYCPDYPGSKETNGC